MLRNTPLEMISQPSESVTAKMTFLLFTTSFVAFKACLMAGSSSSYGMDPQIENDGRIIVLYNSQGEKTRKIALHGEDPTADNRFQHFGKALSREML
jgi:hypothetical protein